MLTPRNLHEVYKKDGAGNTYCVKQTVYKGEILNYPPGFTDMGIVMDSVHTMEKRDTDVWLISFPKSGKCELLTLSMCPAWVTLEEHFYWE